MTLSSWSTKSLEEVSEALTSVVHPGNSPPVQWFQLYVYKDREITLDLIKRAEAAGYTALGISSNTVLDTL